MASRARSRQQELRFAASDDSRRGGARKGAGRPPKGPRSSERHAQREALSGRTPVHVTVRVTPAVGGLRKRRAYIAIREGLITVLRRSDFRVVHVSIQSTHVHFLVEADDARALARGMQGLQISAAKHLNAELSRHGAKRRGTVFTDRYHATQITNPRAARNALAYVLNNWRKHREDRAAFARAWRIDPYSSAISVVEWRELEGSPWAWQPPRGYQQLPVVPAESWLLRVGWKRHGALLVGGAA